MRIIRRISALIIGIVFFISGLLKLMDPVGTGLIVESYLAFFKLGFLASATSVLAYLIALCETICGAALLTGVARKLTAIFALVMLSGFTVVTVVLFIANPEMDCGCFGEAIHLTHAQSLLKNIVLLLFWLLAFIPLSRQERTRKIKFASFALVVVSVLLFGLYTSLSIPPVEFTNYKPGTELFLPEEVGIDEQKTAATLSLAGADGQGDGRVELQAIGRVAQALGKDCGLRGDSRKSGLFAGGGVGQRTLRNGTDGRAVGVDVICLFRRQEGPRYTQPLQRRSKLYC